MGRKTDLETSSFSYIRGFNLSYVIKHFCSHLRLTVNLSYSVFVDSEADFCFAFAPLFRCEAREVDLNYLATVVLNF